MPMRIVIIVVMGKEALSYILVMGTHGMDTVAITNHGAIIVGVTHGMVGGTHGMDIVVMAAGVTTVGVNHGAVAGVNIGITMVGMVVDTVARNRLITRKPT